MCSTHWSGGGQFDSAFGPVNGLVKPQSNLVKLGQPWSNLVKLGRYSPNSWKCISGRVSRVFGHSGPQLGQEQLSQPLVKLGQPWSNLVNPSQIWSNFGKCVSNLLLGSIWCGEPSSDQAGLVWAVLFCVPIPEKIPGVKIGLWQLDNANVCKKRKYICWRGTDVWMNKIYYFCIYIFYEDALAMKIIFIISKCMLWVDFFFFHFYIFYEMHVGAWYGAIFLYMHICFYFYYLFLFYFLWMHVNA